MKQEIEEGSIYKQRMLEELAQELASEKQRSEVERKKINHYSH